MNNFEDLLKTALNKGVEPTDREAMKTRLMSKIHVNDNFYKKVQDALQSIRPTVNAKVLMKEKLITVFELNSGRNWAFLPAFKKLTAGSMAFVLAFVIVVQPFSGVDVVKANSATRVASYSGVVTVVRNGEILNVTKEFILRPDDLLQTGPAGFAEVIYADDSVSRLGSDTRILYNSIKDTDFDFGVEFSVLDGQVWNNTLGLASGENSTFSFVASNVAGQVKIPAVFNIEVFDSQVRVTTLDNSINLLLNSSGQVLPATLSKGQVVTLKKDNSYLAAVAPENIESSYTELDLDWITSNFTQDDQYFKSLTEAKSSLRKSEVGYTPNSLFYPVKKLQRAAKLAFAFDPVRQAEVKLSIANQTLLEAEAMIEAGKSDEAKVLLADYTQKMSSIRDLVTDFSAEIGSEQMDQRALELENVLKSALIAQKKSFKEVLPTSDVYEVKQAINTAEIMVAQSGVERKKVEIKQAQDVLIEAKRLVKENKPELAEENINKYVDVIEKVSDEIQTLPEEQKEEVVSELVESNTTGTALLMGVIQDLNLIESTIEEIDDRTVVSPKLPVVDIKVSEQTSNAPVINSKPVSSDTLEVDRLVVPTAVPVAESSLSKTVESAQLKSMATITSVVQSVETDTVNPALLDKLNKEVSPNLTTNPSAGITIQQMTFTQPKL